MDSKIEKPLIEINGEAVASLEGMDAVHALLDQYWRAAEGALPSVPDGQWRAAFDTSVAEIAGNIVRHAYPASHAAAKLHITLRCFPDHAEAVLKDQGVPYMLVPVTRKPDMTELLESGQFDQGWGLPIAHAAADGIDYERSPEGHNCWRIDKRLPT